MSAGQGFGMKQLMTSRDLPTSQTKQVTSP